MSSFSEQPLVLAAVCLPNLFLPQVGIQVLFPSVKRGSLSIPGVRSSISSKLPMTMAPRKLSLSHWSSWRSLQLLSPGLAFISLDFMESWLQTTSTENSSSQPHQPRLQTKERSTRAKMTTLRTTQQRKSASPGPSCSNESSKWTWKPAMFAAAKWQSSPQSLIPRLSKKYSNI